MTGSLQVKNDKYYIVLNIIDEEGKRKQKWLGTGLEIKGNKKNADKMMRDTLKEYEDKNINLTGFIKFTRYIDEWLDTVKPRIELVSWEAYASYVKSHIRPYFSTINLCVNEIQPYHIQKYINDKHKNGRLDGKGGLSANSVKKHLCVIHSVFQEALRNNMIAYNPADRVRLPKQQKFTGKFYSAEQAKELLKAVKDTPIESAIYIALYYGLRRSEILGLKWSAMNLKENTMVIENTVVRQKTTIEKKTTKNKSSHRTMPLMPEVKEHLKKLKKKQIAQKLLFGKSYVDNDFVCKWDDGRQFNTNYITSKLHKIIKANNMPQIRLHDLRHTTASLLLSMGFSLKEIQEWLGHHDLSTTADIYGHLDYEMKKNIADKFEKLMKIG